MAAIKTTTPSVEHVLIPESLLKKNKTKAVNAAEVAEAKKAKTAQNKEFRRVLLEKAEKQHKDVVAAERAVIVAKREAKASGSIFVPAEHKLVFVVRIKGINKIAPKPRKVLQLLRLHQINNAVFVRMTKATAELLRIVEPYVTFGYPSEATIRKVVYKRGHGKINKQRVALTDNAIIREALGQYGIVGIEDIVHELYTVGPHFKQVSNFLWPFKLSNPSGGWGVRRKFKHFIEGGSLGNREENINDLVLRMN